DGRFAGCDSGLQWHRGVSGVADHPDRIEFIEAARLDGDIRGWEVLTHEASKARLFCLGDHAARAIVKKLIDHDPVVAEHRANETSTGGGEARKFGLDAKTPDESMCQIERFLGALPPVACGLELDDHPVLVKVRDDVDGIARMPEANSKFHARD